MQIPLAACRIAPIFPDAKLIALLRDPVERALSHWNMARLLYTVRYAPHMSDLLICNSRY